MVGSYVYIYDSILKKDVSCIIISISLHHVTVKRIDTGLLWCMALDDFLEMKGKKKGH